VGIHPNPGPGAGEKLTEEERWKIVFYHTENHWTKKRIAKKFKCREHTVIDILEKHRTTGTVHDKPKSGRKRKLSDKESKEMVEQAKKGKFSSQIASTYNKRNKKKKKSVTPRTVRNYLKREGLVYLKFHRVDKLSDDNIKQRLKYSKEMKDFDYKSVLFTDEKTFHLTFVPQGAWAEPGQRLEQKVPKWPKKIHVWGGVGYYFKTKLYFFEENLRGPLYQQILRARLVNEKLIYAPDCPRKLRKNWYFLQDGSKTHKAKKSMELLREIVDERIINHPAMSPDFNVIEDSWSYLVRTLDGSRVSTLDGLKQKIIREWDNMSWTEIRNSVDSMGDRLCECITLKGERTHY
jgi:transposase